MNKWFVTEITKVSDSEAYAKQITEKNTYDEALALYHQILSSAYANPNMVYALVYITNYYGGIDMTERYEPAAEEI